MILRTTPVPVILESFRKETVKERRRRIAAIKDKHPILNEAFNSYFFQQGKWGNYGPDIFKEETYEQTN